MNSSKTSMLNVRLVVPSSASDLECYIDTLQSHFGTIMSALEKSLSDDMDEVELSNVAEPILISSENLLHEPSEIDMSIMHDAVQKAIGKMNVKSIDSFVMSVEDYIGMCSNLVDPRDPLKVYSHITHHILTGDLVQTICNEPTAIAIVDLRD